MSVLKTAFMPSNLLETSVTVFSPDQVADYFQKHDSLEVAPSETYSLINQGFKFSWPSDPDTSSKMIALMFNEMVSPAGKRLKGITSNDTLFITTHKNGFGLMSLTGFTIRCTIKV
jgi:hypothetical protein